MSDESVCRNCFYDNHTVPKFSCTHNTRERVYTKWNDEEGRHETTEKSVRPIPKEFPPYLDHVAMCDPYRGTCGGDQCTFAHGRAEQRAWNSILREQTGSVAIPSPGVVNAPKLAYKMSAKPRGLGVVINNKYFTCDMNDRVGTDRDADSLTSLFTSLGFCTNQYDNLKGEDMRAILQKMGSMDHTNFDCLIVAILTHGVNGKLYSTDGDLISVDTITKCFDGNNCPTLIGKPKVFILQACRGGKRDYGVDSEATDGPSDAEPTADKDAAEKAALDGDETDGGGYQAALPNEADFVLAYATVPGYVSWRNADYGSWFIKSFVDTMYELGKKEHFLDILTEVNRRVAEEFQSKGRNKQIPAPVTMLTRKLYFRPGLFS